jgi:hypothetical protein
MQTYLIIAVSLLLVFVQDARAIVTSDVAGSHVVAPGTVTFDVNLDGVALMGIALSPSPQTFDDILPFSSGALITSRHVMTAAHVLDGDEDGQVDFLIASFPFLAGFELADRTVLLQVRTATVHFATGWPGSGEFPLNDIAVLELVEDAPAGIPRYPLYGLDNEVGQPIVLAGYGATGHGSTGIDEAASAVVAKRAGLNRIEAVWDESLLAYDFDSGQDQHNSLAVLGFASDLGFGVDEAMQARGDSGGPMFIDGALAGIASFSASQLETDFDDLTNSSWGEGGFNTRVSSFQEFIHTATGGQAVFVPEPSAYALAACGLLSAALIWQKRRKTLRRRQLRESMERRWQHQQPGRNRQYCRTGIALHRLCQKRRNAAGTVHRVSRQSGG